MRARRRTADDYGLRCLPTKTVRIRLGRVVIEREMGSRHIDFGLNEHIDFDEWWRMMEERKAVKV